MTVASTTPVAAWDLASSVANETSAIAYPLVFGYFQRDDDGTLVPDLLEKATPSKDYKTWTLTLRSEMTFSDGSPVSSADLKFTLDRLAQDQVYSYLIGSPSLDGIRIKDELSVVLSLAAPNTEVVTLGLSGVVVNLYPADFGGRTEEEYFADPIGAGPFVIESNSDQQVSLVKNDKYWDAVNIKLDRIEVDVVPDNNAKLVGFQSGEYDIVTRQPTSVVGQLESAGEAVVVDPSASVDNIYLNSTKAPFDDVNFRRALWYAIDRETIAEGVFDGYAKPSKGIIPSALPDATPSDDEPRYDAALAEEYLAKSKYADDPSFDLIVIDGDGARRDEAQVIADQLQDIGITVNVRPLSFAEWSDVMFANRSHQAALYGYETVVAPPSDMLGFFVGTAGFFGGYDTTRAAAQFAALQAAPDSSGKAAVIGQFESDAAAAAYAIPLVEPFWIIGVNERVEGLRVPATGFPDVAYAAVAD